MNDCPNGDIRDLLPDLLHGRLDAERRVAVEAHLTGCSDCRAELELLRAAGRALSNAPAVDVSRIVAALPAPMRARDTGRRRFGGWHRAAGLAAVAAGLLTVAIWRRADDRLPGHVPRSGDTLASVAGRESVPAASSSLPGPGELAVIDSPTQRPPADRSRARSAPVVAPTLDVGELSDLSADQLERVLSSLDDVDGIPSAEPPALPSPLTTSGRLQ